MFRHTFLLIYRNFQRFRSTFVINLIGLSSGLACALLIFLWVNDELSVDKIHENDARLYQVLTNQPSEEGIGTWQASPVGLAEALATEMPEVEYAVSTSEIHDNFTISLDENHYQATALFADKNYFTIFSYDLLQGNKNQVLTDKKAVVISEAMAMKLFHTTENVVGKLVEWQFFGFEGQAMVSGIFDDLPTQASQPFDFVLSYEVYKDLLGERAHWGNFNAITYLILRDGTDVLQFNSKIADFLETKREGLNVTLLLQRYADRYLYNHFENGVQAGGRIDYVKLFSVIAIFILAIACINFMNLSTAKASRRIKEVGIKKAVGADRATLIFQYLGESFLMSFLSLLTAIILVALLLPYFNTVTGKQLSFIFTVPLVVSFLGIALLTGLVAGSYPALYLSGFNPTVVLRGKLGSPVGELWARKGLVVFQFALSVILIVSVWVVYQQIALVQTKNLGFDRENIIQFNVDGNITDHPEAFLSEVRNISGVVDASSMVGSVIGETHATGGSFNWEGKNPDAVFQFHYLRVNYGIAEVLGINMKEGRSFSRKFSGDTTAIVLNEAAIATMGLKDPVGKIFNLWGEDLEIIGVTEDFNFASLHENVKPFFFKINTNDAQKVLVRIAAGQERETVQRLQEFYTAFNPGYTFDYQFLDDEYQALYAAEQRVSTLSKYFAGLAILISCLGLFGLAAFTAERRLKEIGIRKILGSSDFGIVRLLSGDFTKMVLVAIAIALPFSYFIARWWLEDFAFSIALQWWYFAGAGLMALLVAWFTVGLQTVKAARVNPADCLRDE